MIFKSSAIQTAATRVPASETRREYVHVGSRLGLLLRSTESIPGLDHKHLTSRDGGNAWDCREQSPALFVKVSETGTRIPASHFWILLKESSTLLVMLGVLPRISYAAFMRETTDEQLMQRYARGNAQAFDQLYARHRGALYRYFRRQVSDEATANDLYQGVWEKIIRARKKYRASSPFAAWMFRIAHNHLVDHFRQAKPVAHTEMAALTDQQAEPAEHAIDGQQRKQLLENIAALPAEQRNTLLLKLETGLKMEEIASVTGTSRETVKSRLRYAVDKLKRNLVE